jgi:hypothetical protein
MAIKRGKVASKAASRAARPAGFTGSKRKIAGYGWKPDLPDQRDHSYAVPAHIVEQASSSVDLRDKCPEVYDQSRIGSCTANGIAAALEFEMMKQGGSVVSCVGIWYDAISGISRVASQAARSIG